MNSDLNTAKMFGAVACALIQYEGTLDQLAAELAVALNLKSFDIEASEYPPFKRIGSAEAMGWEAWLEEESDDMRHIFRLRMETEHSLEERFEERMYDLSPWLARLVTALCGATAEPGDVTPPRTNKRTI